MQIPSVISELVLNFSPYGWQEIAFRKFVDTKLTSFALLADVGTGKTAEAITLLRQIKKEYPDGMKTLVIGPSVVIHNWKNEIHKYCLERNELGTLYPLDEAPKRKVILKDLIDYNKHGVVITNYESFDNVDFIKLIERWKPDVIVSDELHRIKSYKSKRAKAIAGIREKVSRYALGLTGSAILNSPMDLFQQWKFLDAGKTFGKNFFDFRNYYFFDANSKWAGRPGYFPKWMPNGAIFNDKDEIVGTVPGSPFEKLTDRIQYNSIRVIKSECMDLPPYIEETMKLQMGAKQRKIYDQMEKDFVAFIETEDKPAAVVAQLALTKALRLMQIASGFATTDTGLELTFDNPKLDAIEKILEDNENAKVIIWCSYKANYSAIGERLSKLKVSHVFLTGEQDAKEKQASIDSFQSDPSVRVIVANRKAGGIGVNLTAASLSVVYSRNFSLEEEIQSDGRNYRGGSQIHEKITKINLIMEDTIEEKIVLSLQNKQSISEMILDLKNH